MKLRCDFEYCIYNKNLFCTLKEIQINSLGMCEECIIVSISDDTLKEIKENQLKKSKSNGTIRNNILRHFF